ncbi:MAG: VIT1/CCC1 transporter family protein [Patescibacteria group bacterium]
MITSRSAFLSSVRNFIFGAEDSLVSTVGLLAGLFAANLQTADIVLAGLVLIFVEAFSMAVGSFLSEKSIDESQGQKEENVPLFDGVIMFFSYLLCGFIPLFPYIVMPKGLAFAVSIAVTLCALFVLGIVSGKILKTSGIRNALRMLIVGGAAAALGIVVGILFKVA